MLQTKKLGEVCKVFTDGNWIESKDQSRDGIRLIQTGNVGVGVFKDRGEKARYISEKTFNRLRCTEIFKGDCLISRLPDPVGRACILPNTGERMITAVDCSIARFDPLKIIPRYFNYYSQSNLYLDAVAGKTSGTTRTRISRKNLGEIEIPLPPLTEQKRIVKILDEVFEKIEKAKANTEKNLQNSRELFESYLQGVFANPGEGWKLIRLDTVCAIASKLVDPREKRFLNMRHVGAGNIQAKTGELIDVKTAKEEKLISGKFIFDKNMVLYSKIRPYLMKVVRPDFDGLCSADIYPLLPDEKTLNRDFLYYLLLTSGFTKYAILGSDRAGMPKVNREHLFAFEFLLPPFPEQKAIVKKLDALAGETKKLEEIYAKKLACLDELKKSILQQAFAGEL